jgi:hypothetical protein
MKALQCFETLRKTVQRRRFVFQKAGVFSALLAVKGETLVRWVDIIVPEN